MMKILNNLINNIEKNNEINNNDINNLKIKKILMLTK